jgi:dihydroorotate dehydrogenase (fumarate)
MTLATRYLGLDLPSPLVASASPLTRDLDTIRALEDSGAGAVVLPSIFQEQIEAEAEQTERMLGIGVDSFAEALTYFPAPRDYAVGTDHYLDLLRRAREALAIPVIASLNGVTEAGWIDYAQELEEAGASAIELNLFSVPTDLTRSGAEVEAAQAAVLRAVRASVAVPVAVKLSPYYSSTGHLVGRLRAAGADGFVLFNRFYQPDIDLGTLTLRRDLALSTPAEIRLPLLWIGLLAGQTDASLAASGGVDGADQVVKYLLAGADVVMTTSALLRHGPAHMRVLHAGLRAWLAARDVSVGEIRGRMSRNRLTDATAFERANYIRILGGWPG